MGTRERENAEELDAFLAQPGVRVIDSTRDVATRYGILVQQLKAQGTPVPTNDIWIAAAALEHGAHLLSYDTHFSHVPGLIALMP
jgi:predicted nucleic acid-binding protein